MYEPMILWEQRRLRILRRRISLLLWAVLAVVCVRLFAPKPAQPQPTEKAAVWQSPIAQTVAKPAPMPSVPSFFPITPLPGAVLTSGYGDRIDPIHGSPAFHPAIDLAAAEGTPIRAAADGVVTELGFDAVYGQYLRLQHADGYETIYSHCSRIDCVCGQTVAKGETIAAVGSTGRTTGPHLDFRLLYAGEPVDPMGYIGGEAPV